MKWIERIASLEITPAQMWEADQIVRETLERLRTEGEDPDFTASMIALIQHVPEKWGREEVMAITFRMQALAALLKDGHVNDWSIADTTDTNAHLVHEAVIAAAVKARLHLADEPSFDPGEFRALVLRNAEAEGRG